MDAACAHPGGTGPIRDSAIVSDRPALLPAVKLNCTCADVQLENVMVAVPTGSVEGAGVDGRSKTPPVVANNGSVIDRLPGA